jgi:hypothetical protein
VPCDYHPLRNAAPRTRLLNLPAETNPFPACRQLHVVTARVRTPSLCSIAQFFIHRGTPYGSDVNRAGR